MATLEQLQNGLIKADAAGNVEDARAFANEIRKMRSTPEAPQPSVMESIKQGVGNLAAGAIRGAGSIGSTILSAGEMLPSRMIPRVAAGGSILPDKQAYNQRNAGMDAGLQELGANPESYAYKGGKLVGEIAGTAGTGGVLANVARSAGAAPTVVNALRSGGMAGGGNMATRIGAGAATGAASTAMINPEDAGLGAGIGAAIPVLGKVASVSGNALGRAVRGKEISPEVSALYQKAQQYGVDIPADRLADSKPMNALASTLNYVPFSGRAATEQKMSTQLNQALSKTFGQDSPNVTMALRKAESDLGSKFDSVLKSNTVKIDPQFTTEMQSVLKTAEKELGADALKPIQSQINEILEKGATGQIDGQAAYNIKKTLDRIGNNAGNESYHARELKKSLMGALDRSLGADEAAKFATVRQQYGNMMELQKLAKNGAEGEISVARLANMKNIRNPEMQDLADIAAQFVKPRESQHGAMQRAVAAGAGAVSYSTGGMGAIPIMLGAGAGRGANALLNSSSIKNMMLRKPSENRLAELLQYAPRVAPAIAAQ